jgi:hypothetical protein
MKDRRKRRGENKGGKEVVKKIGGEGGDLQNSSQKVESSSVSE